MRLIWLEPDTPFPDPEEALQEPADVGYINAFLPRPQPMQTGPNDANAVICARVFAARN